MKIRFGGNPQLYDAELTASGDEWQMLGIRFGLVVRQAPTDRIFISPEAIGATCLVVRATPDEQAALREYGYMGQGSEEELPPTDGEIPF
jgi:hypothetical protein